MIHWPFGHLQVLTNPDGIMALKLHEVQEIRDDLDGICCRLVQFSHLGNLMPLHRGTLLDSLEVDFCILPNVTKVLICGNDATLLRIRAKVFDMASFNADVLIGAASLRNLDPAEAPDLFILCTSMPRTDRDVAKTVIQGQLPDTPVLTLLRPSEDADENGQFVKVIDGPAKLIEISKKLTRTS